MSVFVINQHGEALMPCSKDIVKRRKSKGCFSSKRRGLRMSSEYRTLNHSKFLIMYHIIFVVKYRKKRLKRYGEDIKQFIFEIAKKSDFDIQEMIVPKDHIHFGVTVIFVALLVMLPLKP